MAEEGESVAVDPKARKVGDKQAAPQAVAQTLSDDVSASAEITNGSSTVFTVTLESIYDLRLFAFPQVALFLTSVSDANQIFGGSNITASQWFVAIWIDWQSTDDNNIKLKVHVRNATGSTQTVLLRANFRYILEDKGVS